MNLHKIFDVKFKRHETLFGVLPTGKTIEGTYVDQYTTEKGETFVTLKVGNMTYGVPIETVTRPEKQKDPNKELERKVNFYNSAIVRARAQISELKKEVAALEAEYEGDPAYIEEAKQGGGELTDQVGEEMGKIFTKINNWEIKIQEYTKKRDEFKSQLK